MSDWDTISKIRARYYTRNPLLYTGHAVDQRASAARERQVFHQNPHERTSPALYTVTGHAVDQRASAARERQVFPTMHVVCFPL